MSNKENSLNNPFEGYETGTDFWRDNAISYGIEEALIIGRNYLSLNLKREHSEEERQFCRELFTAMYKATADKIIPHRLVYPYDLKDANERTEASYFHKNQDMNTRCAHAIDAAIRASNYQTNYYNLELAAMLVIEEHGFERVCLVLAFQIKKHEYDGRYSSTNKKWARHFFIPEGSCGFLGSHAILIEDFVKYTRKNYEAVGAGSLALLGQEEHGEYTHGYEIKRAIMVDDKQGYAIAHNPSAVDPWTCWQFYIRDGGRSYNWGMYGEEQTAINAYNARLFVAFN